MIRFAQSRKLNFKKVLSQPFGPIPWAIANNDGTFQRSDKAVLRKELAKVSNPAEDIPQPSVSAIEGICIIQRVKGIEESFNHLAESLFLMVMNEASDSQEIHIIFDAYRNI